ncbi:MAG: hypothetical protein HYR85_05855 [Planctomycetes bacterium]|nr:hypothetical protein [Planctomycetota bacterium]
MASSIGCASPDGDPPPSLAATGPTPVATDLPSEPAFHDSLAPYGDWIQLSPYGSVWVPRGLPPDWRPYTDGHWVFADDGGWTWVSDADWGWAPFHYGRWFFDDQWGWVWVPGSEWAPAWVAWRSNDDCIGWAPLPPSAGFSFEAGLTVGNFDIAEPCWVFVRRREFLEPNLRERVLLAPRNVTLLRETREVPGLVVVDRHLVNRGIAVEEVERAAGHPVEHVRLVDAKAAAERRLARREDGSIRVFRPDVPDRGRPNVAATPSITAEGLAQRHAAEQRALEAHFAAQRNALIAQHQRELADRSARITATELQARHEAELRSHEQMLERQRQVLRNRQIREAQRPAPRPAPPNPATPRPPHSR